MSSKRTCGIEGCDKKFNARDMCSGHYQRWKYTGVIGGELRGHASPGETIEYAKTVAATHDGEECLLWPYAKGFHGYGKLNVDGRSRCASRYVCEIAYGPAPEPSYEAAHLCGVALCVSAAHLQWKTHIDNELDKIAHGTLNIGSRNGQAKLTETQVSEILEARGIATSAEVARTHGVSRRSINAIWLRKKWRHVPDPHQVEVS